MKNSTYKKIPKLINLVVAGIMGMILIIAGITPYFDFRIALTVFILLVFNSYLMMKSYSRDNTKFGNILFIINLLIPIVLSLYRLVGTDFREGYIEILIITLPLLVLIVWNQRINKKTGYNGYSQYG